MTDPDHRFAVVAAAGTFVVAVLLGLLGGVSQLGDHYSLAFSASGPGAVVSYWLVTAGISLLGALTVVLSGFAVARSKGSNRKRELTLLGAALVVGFPVLLLFAVSVFNLSNAPGGRYTTPVLLVLLLPSLAVGAWLGRRHDDALPWVPGLHTLLAAALLTGLAVGGFAAPPVESAIIETGGSHAPQVTFDAEYDPAGNGTGVLTVTHAGGDAIQPDRLAIHTDDAAEVPDAVQTSSGPWRGEVSDGGAVRRGDAVTIGVESDCTVRIVFVQGDRTGTLQKFDCAELRDGG